MLTESENLLKDMVADFARDKIAPHSAKWRKDKGYPASIFDDLGQLGLMGMQIDQKYGGSEVSTLAYVIAIEEIAKADCALSTAVAVHNSLVPRPVADFGSEELKNRFLPDIASGKTLGAFCLTEPQAGSNAAAIELKAQKSGTKYHLTGTKQFITSGKLAKIGIVFARTSNDEKKGLSAFIVPMDKVEVIRLEDKMGQEASDCAQLAFDCTVDAENLIGSEGMGYKIALAGLEAGRLGIAAQAIGVASNAFERALSYAKQRRSFGKAIIEHQAVEFMLADMATRIEASRALLHKAAKMKDEQQGSLKFAAMAKLNASQMCLKVCEDAIQVFGGYGYLKEYEVEALYRDARVITLYEGTSEIQKIIIGKALARG